jgi:GH15 family glucan-1,4-alpha-glucosidase
VAEGIAPSPRALHDYALLADGERGALIGPRGEVVWLCAPRWHDDAVFSALIGGTSFYSITPSDAYTWGGYYEDGSLIWHSRWTTTSGIAESREALAYPADPHRVVLLRRVRAIDAPRRLDVRLRPTAGFDATGLSDTHRRDGVWTGRVGELYLRWQGVGDARRHDHGRHWEGVLELAREEVRDLVLEVSDRPLPDELPSADDLWSGTEAQWQRSVPPLDGGLAPRDTRRSYAVLRGLTSSTGGMVAAATTSLPERAEAGRNYDYRYAWIRDQCYAGQAVAAHGADAVAGGLLDSAVSFVGARLLADRDHLAPAYTVLGDPVPRERHIALPGYPGGADVVGNWVRDQFQLDAFGESLLLFAAAARHGRLDGDGWTAAAVAASAIAARWTEPDAGIWEIEPRAWTHSRLTAAAGLRALAAVRSSGGATESDGRVADWISLADTIVADTARHALHPDGHWQRAPEDAALDAALLLPGLRGAVPATDPRTRATLAAYRRELTLDGYAYRFRHDARPLPEAEGSFLLCGFIVALALQAAGDPVEARAWFERTRSAYGPAQLFSEEYDAVQHQMRGNVPQAFVHALAVEAAARLSHPVSGGLTR